VGNFLTDVLVVGNTLSFDITSIFNTAISNGDSSLGMRLAATTDPDGGAWVFNNFRLTSSDETTAVPAPVTLALLGLGLGALPLRRRRQQS
jgi:hypothetical protein